MRVLRRTVWYIASRLFLVCLILGIAITVFYYAMNLSNIQIIVKDGMAKRAKVIMGIDGDSGGLGKYFQTACMSSDTELMAALNGNSAYADYKVRGIDHRLELGFVWIWPWETTARLNITENIPRIDGRAKGTKADELIEKNGPGALYPPEWAEGRYRITLIKENNQWKIKNMTPVPTH